MSGSADNAAAKRFAIIPRTLSKWIFLSFTLAVLCFLLWNADALDSVMLSFVAVPWIVGPIGLTAFFVRRADTLVLAWTFFVIEFAAAGSTIAYWTYLNAYPDGQNGIAIMFLPIAQFAGVLVLSFIAVAIVALFEWRRPAGLPVTSPRTARNRASRIGNDD